MSAKKLREKLTEARGKGKLPKVVIPVHFAGQSCEMEEIKSLSNEYGFKIIEDASHAIGARYKEQPVGSCKYSDITVFSFHPVKIITTGEGGAVLTNSKKLFERVRSLRSHGISREELSFINPSHGPWYYEQQSLGFNYRITDLQCALGLSQLARVESFVQKRNEIANKYHEMLQNLPLILPKIQSERLSSFHLYTLYR